MASRKPITHNGTIDTHELAWAAGFFDGEGTTGMSGRQLRLRVSQVGYSTLDRFQRALGGMGKIRQRTYDAPRQSQYVYEIERINEVYLGAWLLWVWLSAPKREQIERAFARYHELRKG